MDIKIKVAQYNEVIEKLFKERQLHMDSIDAAKNAKQATKQQASVDSSSIQAIYFDLQKTLPTPMLRTGIIYYSR